ncbi:CUB and zona pellucida-like domain-containing protein 1 [Biomphalaria glabrata]|nr:CUB and zona pellucida domain-containing protein 1 [Biomphalaria glabrata]
MNVLNCFYFCVFVFLYTLSVSSLTTSNSCGTKTSMKLDYGIECNVSSDCWTTNYCNRSRCACPPGLYFDTCAGSCVKKNGFIINSMEIPLDTSYNMTISGKPNSYIVLVITEADFLRNCTENYVTVSETTNLLLLNKVCQSNIFTPLYVASRTNLITITYKSANSGFRGFKGLYYISESENNLTDTSGYIVSPGYPPIMYTGSSTFPRTTWLITAKTGYYITLSLQVVNLTNNDALYVYDGPNTTSSLLVNLTHVTNETYTSTFNTLFLQLNSSSYIPGGFAASYATQGQSHGHICNSTHVCSDDLVCNEGLCECNTSYYFDNTTKTCKNRLSFGGNCSFSVSDMCLSNLTCTTDRFGTDRCLCPDNMYEYLGSCYPDLELRVSVSGKFFANVVYLSWTTLSRNPDVTYIVSWMSSQNEAGHGNLSTSLSEVYISRLSPQQNYTFTVTSVLTSDSFYNSKYMHTTFTALTESLYFCTENNQCGASMICINQTCVSTSEATKDGMDTLQNALIAIAVIGWVATIGVVVAVIIVCLRKKDARTSLTRDSGLDKNPDGSGLKKDTGLSKKSSGAIDNNYNSVPMHLNQATQNTAEDTYVNNTILLNNLAVHTDTSVEPDTNTYEAMTNVRETDEIYLNK